ncbi:MAG: gluconate 2-dehydrogenase subunit 3 family protein [Balneolaceae bacterium]
MKRRDAIKNLMLASGGLIALPSWAMNWKASSIIISNDIFTTQQHSILSSLVDTIIPSNGTIGALSVGVDTFLAALISKCYEVEVQDDVKENLDKLDEIASNKFQKAFPECSQKERESLLMEVEIANQNEGDSFFNFIKSQTIRGFRTSEEVMMNYYDFVLMPGFYDGNVDVEA